MSVEAGVRRDLTMLGKGAEDSALAESALALAAEMDDPENSATSKSMCARALLDTMDRLRELAPPKKEADPVDELGERRRSARRNRGAAS